MKKILLFLHLLILSVDVKSQFCSQASLVNMGNITPTGVLQTVTGASGSRRYWTFNATAGCTYTLSTCGSPNSNDTYLRLYQGTNPANALLVAQNDDNGPLCSGNKASIVWTCPTTGAYSILLTNFSCNTLSASTNLSHRVVCAPAFNPCNGIYPNINCGVNVNWTFASGNGAWNPPSNTCGFSTPGQEKIYVFTPSVTGVYNISQSNSFNWIDYFFKPVTGGCSSTGWTCIGDLFGNSVSNGFNLTAGVQYYILLNPESTTGGAVTFSIQCPGGPVFNPCSGIYPNINCGVNVNWTFASGNGAWNPPSNTCGFSTPGQEKIYVFTPSVTGVYNINQISSFTFIDYFFKPVTGGCSSTGWTCIGDLIGASTSLGFNLTAGVQYYILLDPESSVGGGVTFNIQCPGAPPFDPCTGVYPTINCGVNVNWSVTPGNGAWNPPSNTCGFSTPGQEKIYVFTAPSTGGYTLNQISSFTWIDYWFKPVSGGCNGTGWTCIDDLFGNMSSLQFNLTGGIQYYVVLDPESTSGGDISFNIACPPVNLPIQLLEFSGVSELNFNHLWWTTATEINNDYFTLERSLDAQNWTVINTQLGQYNSKNYSYYNYKDYDFRSGVPNYYRLSQTDLDGKRKYFRIISLNKMGSIECEEFEYYDLVGRKVDIKNVASGIYLRKCGDQVEKIIKN